jgi:hypothetical protein
VGEMLEEGYFFLEFALLGVFSERVLGDCVDFLVGFFFDVFKVLEITVEDDFG